LRIASAKPLHGHTRERLPSDQRVPAGADDRTPTARSRGAPAFVDYRNGSYAKEAEVRYPMDAAADEPMKAPAELKLLGTDTDKQVAMRIGRTVSAARAARARAGIAPSS